MGYQYTKHITAGQLHAGKEKGYILQAYLGTCVGLALYDESKKIGGLIHILLPEPPSTDRVEFPEKYASTGVPILINKLIELGASPGNLKASIAGGALVCPVSRQDISLDIGGRSSEVTLSILQSFKIKTIKSETGGFFPCNLELDMKSGRTFIKPAFESNIKPQESRDKPSWDDIHKTIDHLKPIPQTTLKILRMLRSDQSNISQIAKELSHDQVLAGKTLKLCNSVAFAGSIKIESLKEAVLLLGENMLLKSIITTEINDYFAQTGTSGYSLCRGGFFSHAVGVASLCEKISKKTKISTIESAYTAGLLHDIGKVVLDQYLADCAPNFFRHLRQENGNCLTAERESMGITHCTAGAFLAKKWNFSDRLSQVIKFHHTPEKTEDNKNLVYIVYLADLLMEKFYTGLDLGKMQTKSFENALDHLGLTMEEIPELIDAVPMSAIG